MKNVKINVAELLKNCPSGMELDCTMFNDVVFNTVEFGKTIIVTRTNGTDIHLDKYGTFSNGKDAKCVIFPKGKTTWEGFVPPCKFKDGDVLVVNYSDGKKKACFENIFILNKPEYYGKWNSYCHLDGVGCFHSKATYLAYDKDNPRFATEEEKQKLFDSIKANGYKWNQQTNTLERLIEHQFKVGDRIRHKCPEFRGERIVNICCDTGYFTTINDWIDIEHQDDWELVPNKFDITTFKPFDKVLVRMDNKHVWEIQFFERLHTILKDSFVCMGRARYHQCIPYDGNEHLLNTAKDCEDYFKTWE